jgi:DNA/RNA-binding domain of Phe-tRNA-synthetase-like protein
MKRGKYMKFIVDKAVFEQIPNLKIGALVCTGLDNTQSISFASEFASAKDAVREKFMDVELAEYPVIRKWRDIYKSFGEKKARSSVEALIRRTVNGNDIPSINPLVDLYNLASLKFELPCGGENLDIIKGNIELTLANGSESFLPLGESEIEKPNVGEIIYKFQDTVICRNLNYRESDITKLTSKTKNAIIVFECINDDNITLNEALDYMSKHITEKLGGTVQKAILDNANKELEIN